MQSWREENAAKVLAYRKFTPETPMPRNPCAIGGATKSGSYLGATESHLDDMIPFTEDDCLEGYLSDDAQDDLPAGLVGL